MNKYNVRAIRKELDDCVRHNSWKKFRSKLKDLRSKPELFQAVVMAKSKLTRGTLLHALLKLPHFPLDLVTEIATTLPAVLVTTDSVQQQTPLHIALERQIFSPDVIHCFLELNTSSLTMADRNGDTPLLKAARGDCDISCLKLLLRYDIQHTTALVESKRKRRTPLWYIASNDLQLIHSGYQEIPENLRLIMLESYFALQRKYANLIVPLEKDWDFYMEELNNNYLQRTPSTTTRQLSEQQSTYHDEGEHLSLILRAFVACIDMLGKYSVKLLEFFLNRESYKKCITSQTIDEAAGNYLIHQLCATEIADKATASILLEQLLRHTHHHPADAGLLACPNAHGNLPLHLAVAHGKDSFASQLLPAFPDSIHHQNHRGELPLHMALKNANLPLSYQLWTAYRTAAEFVDGHTGLYPFQLAALCAASYRTKDNEELSCDDGNISWFSFVFELLLAAPLVLGMTTVHQCSSE